VVKVEKSGSSSINRTAAESALGIEKVHVDHAPAHPATQAGGNDQAALSEQARVLNKARAAMETVPEVRTEKVTALRDQVNSGNYHVPLEELARRLLVRLGLRHDS
jgi:flagellar biosynthesis anti-sigma factor FlgM